MLWNFWREQGYLKSNGKEYENSEAKILHRENVEKIEKKIEDMKENRKNSKSIKSKWEILKNCAEIIENTCENWGSPEDSLEIEKIMTDLGQKREIRLKMAQEKKNEFRGGNLRKNDCEKPRNPTIPNTTEGLTKIVTSGTCASIQIEPEENKKKENTRKKENAKRKLEMKRSPEENLCTEDKNLSKSSNKKCLEEDLPVSDMGDKYPTSYVQKSVMKKTLRKSGLVMESPQRKISKLKKSEAKVIAKGEATKKTLRKGNISKVNLIVKSFENLKRGNKTELFQLYNKKKETPSDIVTTLPLPQYYNQPNPEHRLREDTSEMK